jgi:hypothetical protein
MLIPSLLAPTRPLHFVGNTPAVSLTRSLPQGLDADILLLGSTDVRHILYTAYSEQGFRRLHLPVALRQVCGTLSANGYLWLF